MFAKVFNQIFDSSIADDFKLRHFFMDLLVLADVNGVVDMTPTAIAARTRIPIDDVREMIQKLEMPDAESRTPDHDGRRIVRLDEHRTWGWHVINYHKFRDIASEEQRRSKTLARVRKYRGKDDCNAPVTHGNACNAMQRQKQMHLESSGDANIPIFEEIKAEASIRCINPTTAEKFFNHYQGNNLWLNQHGRLIDWRTKLRSWSVNERTMNNGTNNKIGEKRIDRSIGTTNEGVASQYADFMRLAKNKKPQ